MSTTGLQVVATSLNRQTGGLMDNIDNLLRGLSLYTVRKTPKIFCVLEIYALSKCPSFDGSFHETLRIPPIQEDKGAK